MTIALPGRKARRQVFSRRGSCMSREPSCYLLEGIISRAMAPLWALPFLIIDERGRGYNLRKSRNREEC